MSNYLLSLVSSQREDPSDTTSNFEVRYQKPLSLKGQHSIALVNATIPYAVHNISEKKGNNVLYIRVFGNLHPILFPDGLYGIPQINARIREYFDIQENEQDIAPAILYPDTTRISSYWILKNEVQVLFNQTGTFRDIIGFGNVELDGVGVKHYSTKPVDINGNNQHFYITCSLVNSSYTRAGSKTSNILYGFNFRGASGTDEAVTPIERIYLPISSQYVDSIRISIVNQDGEVVDLLSNNIVVNLKIRHETMND